MKPALRVVIAMMLLGFAVLAIMGCAGCRGKPPAPVKPPDDTPESIPPEVTQNWTGDLSGAKFSIGLEGQRAWAAEVKSGKITSENGRQTFTLTGLTCHMYKQGREVLQVSADTGTAVRVGKTLRTDLTGHIRAVAKEKDQHLQADAFHWTSRDDTIHADHFTWGNKGATLHADRGTFTIDLSDATFDGNVRLETTGGTALR